ncbi:MAG TPA: HAD family hydrolase, partial [Puia sp.]|nr:HAD family hydrolase [Puia sp.]
MNIHQRPTLSIANLMAAVFLISQCFSCQGSGNKPAAGSTTDTVSTSNTDPLPGWSNGALKTALVTYVKEVTDSSSKNFIPVADRIATFDNDGTLWAEKPYVQELFCFYMVKKILTKNPKLANKQPFKAVVEQDKNYFEKGGDKAFIELAAVTNSGTTEDEYESTARDFFASGSYPKWNVPFKQITYAPQVELLQYLRANGFKTFICTGGTIEFVRVISQEYYGVPKDQVIGTSFQYVFVDSNRTIFRKPALGSFNDKTGKPVNIQLHIGQRPVFACGNEGGAGDIAMLEYCQSSKYPSFQMIVNHDDSTREFYYQEKDSASLKAAAK